jgi:MauM/NapG family ferredoxin protein
MKKIKGSFRSSKTSVGRLFVQIGFLLLFLFPWVPVVYSKINQAEVPVFASWLLPFGILTNLAKGIHGDVTYIVFGSTLFLLAFSLVFGRAFCGWICPLGTFLDLIRPFAFWQKKSNRRHSTRNNRFRFYLLTAIIAASFVSLQIAGWFDPLTIFNSAATSILFNLFITETASMRVVPFAISGIFFTIIVLEFIRPRTWCRNICPMGALLSLPARFSFLNRVVTNDCTHCGECRAVCPMNAIGNDPHDTSYTDCTFCLECESKCPNEGIEFQFKQHALSRWVRKTRQKTGDLSVQFTGDYVSKDVLFLQSVSRRQVLGMIAGGAAGLASAIVFPKTATQVTLIRPPGAIPEEFFVTTCITCQECIRVCPSQALRPAFWEAGLAAVGTPYLAFRQGACIFGTDCAQLCAQVCPVGAIQSIPISKMKTGVAHIDYNTCLAWDQGVKCLVCVEACPYDAAVSISGRVVVDERKCTGCGRCVSGCPIPGGAIQVKTV